MSAATLACPRCGYPIAPGARFCPSCGYPLAVGTVLPGPAPPPFGIMNTHTEGFIVAAFLISFLWFRVNGMALVPVGLLGGLVISWWSHDIDQHLGKPSQFTLAAVLCAVGALIGYFL